ncbi:unnamed protein product [Ixodes persulcatus]
MPQPTVFAAGLFTLGLGVLASVAAGALPEDQVQEFLKSYQNDNRPVCQTEASQLHRRRRIVGGRSAEPDDFGYMVESRIVSDGIRDVWPGLFCSGIMLRHSLFSVFRATSALPFKLPLTAVNLANTSIVHNTVCTRPIVAVIRNKFARIFCRKARIQQAILPCSRFITKKKCPAPPPPQKKKKKKPSKLHFLIVG